MPSLRFLRYVEQAGKSTARSLPYSKAICETIAWVLCHIVITYEQEFFASLSSSRSLPDSADTSSKRDRAGSSASVAPKSSSGTYCTLDCRRWAGKEKVRVRDEGTPRDLSEYSRLLVYASQSHFRIDPACLSARGQSTSTEREHHKDPNKTVKAGEFDNIITTATTPRGHLPCCKAPKLRPPGTKPAAST